jgi:hypothetical protein
VHSVHEIKRVIRSHACPRVSFTKLLSGFQFNFVLAGGNLHCK